MQENTTAPTITVYPGVISSYKNGWKQLWRNSGVIVLAWIIMMVIAFSLSFIIVLFVPQGWIYWIFSFGFGIFVSGPINFGFSYIILNAARDFNVATGDIFESFDGYWNVVLANILLYIYFSIPAIISQVVNIYVPEFETVINLVVYILFIAIGCKLAFIPFLVVDRKMKAIDSVKTSWKMTNRYEWKIILIFLLGIPIVIAGLVCLIVGIIPATFWICMALASLYHAIEQRETKT